MDGVYMSKLTQRNRTKMVKYKILRPTKNIWALWKVVSNKVLAIVASLQQCRGVSDFFLTQTVKSRDGTYGYIYMSGNEVTSKFHWNSWQRFLALKMNKKGPLKVPQLALQNFISDNYVRFGVKSGPYN